ncbi:FeoB-associated Cys-rich membrane protein [Anaerolentibacter hominis]|uniref:FeoB-associated Cys-rich membrane protein n=1 Tax=Anaerolentibacter hominis TaxID=3079009 RepID=UPI0031B8270C
MIEFFAQYGATIIISLILLGLVILAVAKIRRDKKNGRCCGGCSGCSGSCHVYEEKQKTPSAGQ